jgi:DHA2 family multidrug resistance protein
MAEEAAEGVPSGLKRWLIVTATLTGSSLFLFSVTIVAIATPYLQGSFSAAPDQIAWLGTSYLIGTTIVTGCSGWISNRFGRRRLFLYSIAGFTLFSLLGGIAGSLSEMVVYRTFQGMFGAPLLPLGQAITLDAFPRARQGLANIVFSVGATMGIVVGPIFGGILIADISWRWVFFINIPVGLVAWLGVLAFVPESTKDPGRRLDWYGFGTLVVALAAAMLALTRGQRLNWLSSTEVAVEVAVAVLAFYIFVVHSLTTPKPFIEPRLFRDRNYVVGLVMVLAWGAQIYLPVFLIPIQLQSLAGYPVTFVGLLLTARGIGNVVGALAIIGVSDRLDPRIVFGLAVFFLAIAPWGMSNWSLDIRPWDVVWLGGLQGVGIGMSFVPLTQLALATLDRKLMTEAIALLHLLLNIGAAFGIAMIFYVLSSSIQFNYETLTRHISPYNEAFHLGFAPKLWDLGERSGLMAMETEVGRQAAMIAFNNSFYLTALISALMLPLALLARRPPR